MSQSWRISPIAGILQAYLGAATKDRAHPLRYLQKYLCDQFHFKLPEAETEVAAAGTVR